MLHDRPPLLRRRRTRPAVTGCLAPSIPRRGPEPQRAFRGTRVEAQRELRRLIKSADDGEHVAPNKITLAQWSEQWLRLLGRGEQTGVRKRRRRGLVSPRTRERYGELLASYVLPKLGHVRLQALTVSQLDDLYIRLEDRISLATVNHVHVALRACLATAQRKGILVKNPADDADVPRPEESGAGQVLSADELKRLLDGFKGSVLYPIIATASFTGARLSELLALRWSDLDPIAKTLRIERAIEQTAEHGRVLKEPKSARGKRTITIDDALLAMLMAEHRKALELVAGVPDGADVDLTLIKLPPDSLMFPSPKGATDLAKLRHPKAVTRETRERFRKLGFATLRFHDLRASHGTALLDKGVPVHVVAARLGHDPAVLLKAYAKRTPQSDAAAAKVIGELSSGIL